MITKETKMDKRNTDFRELHRYIELQNKLRWEKSDGRKIQNK